MPPTPFSPSNDQHAEARHDEQELVFLLEQRTRLALAQITNEELQASLRQGIESHIPGAIEELRQVEDLLDLADEIYERDNQETVLTDATQRDSTSGAILPLFKTNLRCEDVLDLRALTTDSAWTKADEVELSRVVLAECMRRAAFEIQRRHPRGTANALLEVQKLTPEELSCWSLPEPQGSSDDPLNWETIASKVAISSPHTPSSCRTHWLMNLRPGLRGEPWSESDLKILRDMVDRDASEDDRIDWHQVASHFRPPRQPAQCLAAYCQNFTLQPAKGPQPAAAAKRAAEDEELLHLVSIWGFDWSLLSEKLQRSTTSIKKRFQIALDTQLTRGKWQTDEVERLHAAIREQVTSFEATLPAPQSDAELSLHERSLALSLDWIRIAASVETRSPTQCREKWTDRQEQLRPDPRTDGKGAGDPVSVVQQKRPRAIKWSAEEDARLIEAMELSFAQASSVASLKGTGGAWTWTQVGAHVGNRNDKQARDRWSVVEKRTQSQEDSKEGTERSVPMVEPEGDPGANTSKRASQSTQKGNKTKRNKAV